MVCNKEPGIANQIFLIGLEEICGATVFGRKLGERLKATIDKAIYWNKYTSEVHYWCCIHKALLSKGSFIVVLLLNWLNDAKKV